MKSLKLLASRILGRLGRTGILDRVEAPLLGLTKYLLDPAVLRSATHACRIRGMPLDALCNPHLPFHRSMYWFGRLHERGLDDLMRRVLRPGDTLIDVGANFGHVSMLGASLVASAGRVHAFEPHPGLASQLADHLTAQVCRHVTVHRIGLSDRDGEFALHVKPNHLGASTLREVEGGDGFSVTYQVQVRRGADVLRPEDLTGLTFLKIDVEGHEPAVIDGMADLIRDRVDVMAIEVTPDWHGGAGGVDDLIGRVVDLGLRPFLLRDDDSGPLLRSLGSNSIEAQSNVAFVRPDLAEELFSPTREGQRR